MAIGEAIDEAARLDEIGFPEFTAKLITDTFDAIVAANMRQTDAYIQLVQQVAKELPVYINDTHDEIGGEELVGFLAAVLPPENADAKSDPTKVVADGDLNRTEVQTLNTAVEVATLPDKNRAIVLPDEGQTVTLTQTDVDAILTAVAKRLAANKYDLLKEMVKMGILRLVVEKGTIETRLTISTYANSSYLGIASEYHRDTYRHKRKTHSLTFLGLWGGVESSTRYKTNMTVTTAKEIDRDVEGSSVQIYGSVVIHFKTDYQPLAA